MASDMERLRIGEQKKTWLLHYSNSNTIQEKCICACVIAELEYLMEEIIFKETKENEKA